MANDHSFLSNLLIYLTAAVIMVPLAKRFGLGSVLGYLVAGVIIGPWGLGLIAKAEQIMHFAEFGVVMLLFLIGLELEPARLWQMRRLLLGAGLAQVVVTSLALTLIGYAFGLEWRTAAIVGMGLSLSSTAIALQTLQEKNKFQTPAGQLSFAVLLLQDIAVIPMLALLPLLGASSQASTTSWESVVNLVAVIAAIVLLGRYLVRPMFRFIAATRAREIFTAFSLLLVIGIAMLMEAVELSMALGAFLAGVLLAESEYRHELEVEIEPFKGLLLGLFFMAVGMMMDVSLLLAHPLLFVGAALLLVLVKILILAAIGFARKLNTGQTLLFAFMVSQGGEFAFVLFSVAGGAAIPSELAKQLMMIAALSMATTPLLALLHEKLVQPRLLREKRSQKLEEKFDRQHNPVIIAGYGRFGQVVGRLLHSMSVEATILDNDPDRIELLRKYGHKVFFGDPSRLDLLHAAGAESARVIVVTLDDIPASLTTIDLVRQHFPHLRIVARAYSRDHAHELLNRGADVFVREVFHSALIAGEEVLKQLGYGAYRAKSATLVFRDHEFQTFYDLHPYRKDETTFISRSKQARDDLVEVMSRDEERLKQEQQSW